jgi:hypothetical protein
MPSKSVVAALALLAGGLSVHAAQAAQVTLTGTTFDITYDDTRVGLFGAPAIVGNSVLWFPSGSPGFAAQTDGGIDVTNSTFAMTVTAKPGFFLTGFSLTEGGDYFFFGGQRSAVMASGQLRVTPLPGSTSHAAITADSSFAAGAEFDFTTRNWTASASLAAARGTTRVNASIQNILSAYVIPPVLGYAFIEKKEVMLGIAVSPVPEPHTYALMLAGVAVVGFVVLRRRR